MKAELCAEHSTGTSNYYVDCFSFSFSLWVWLFHRAFFLLVGSDKLNTSRIVLGSWAAWNGACLTWTGTVCKRLRVAGEDKGSAGDGAAFASTRQGGLTHFIVEAVPGAGEPHCTHEETETHTVQKRSNVFTSCSLKVLPAPVP